MSHLLALHKALLSRLVGAVVLTDLVPADHILDRNGRPVIDPSVVFGEDLMLEGDDLDRRNVEVVSTLHVWAKGTGLVAAKQIAGAVRSAIHTGRLEPVVAGYQIADCRVSDMRFLRDPDGETGHGVITVRSLVSEV